MTQENGYGREDQGDPAALVSPRTRTLHDVLLLLEPTQPVDTGVGRRQANLKQDALKHK